LALRPVLTAVFGLAATAWVFASPANADDRTPTPPASPTSSPAATPSSSATAAPSVSPSSKATSSPSPSPSDSSASSSAAPAPTQTPGATASPSAQPSPSATPDLAAARARDAALLANARSLTQIIEAQARVAQDELSALEAQIAQVGDDLNVVTADLADLHARSSDRRGVHDRATRDALRLLELPPASVPADLTEAQQDALAELRSLEASLVAGQAALSERAETLARLKDSVAAKQAHLTRLRDRARILAAAAALGDTEARAAQVAVLRGLAQDATAAQTALAQLVASALIRDAKTETTWSLPVRGPITQPFGPSALTLEPARSYEGVTFAHFHDAIDIAAPLGTPVAAAADGKVTFVGHLPDGAMIVLVAHPGGLVSLYAHLDDAFALPPVKAGQAVKAGQVIGFIGLTGMTTGPHLHFAVMRNGQPIDPLSLIAG
jgi:murein DD-endopeptidase MepM/ murein hydrolase activator NlpD